MSEGKISPHEAQELDVCFRAAEKTVSVHLYRVRRKLLLQLGADRPFDDDAGEGASP